MRRWDFRQGTAPWHEQPRSHRTAALDVAPRRPGCAQAPWTSRTLDVAPGDEQPSRLVFLATDITEGEHGATASNESRICTASGFSRVRWNLLAADSDLTDSAVLAAWTLLGCCPSVSRGRRLSTAAMIHRSPLVYTDMNTKSKNLDATARRRSHWEMFPRTLPATSSRRLAPATRPAHTCLTTINPDGSPQPDSGGLRHSYCVWYFSRLDLLPAVTQPRRRPTLLGHLSTIRSHLFLYCLACAYPFRPICFSLFLLPTPISSFPSQVDGDACDPPNTARRRWLHRFRFTSTRSRQPCVFAFAPPSHTVHDIRPSRDNIEPTCGLNR